MCRAEYGPRERFVNYGVHIGKEENDDAVDL